MPFLIRRGLFVVNFSHGFSLFSLLVERRSEEPVNLLGKASAERRFKRSTFGRT